MNLFIRKHRFRLRSLPWWST